MTLKKINDALVSATLAWSATAIQRTVNASTTKKIIVILEPWLEVLLTLR
jgi:hypothetical protein